MSLKVLSSPSFAIRLRLFNVYRVTSMAVIIIIIIIIIQDEVNKS
jgi:hypothetical protein